MTNLSDAVISEMNRLQAAALYEYNIRIWDERRSHPPGRLAMPTSNADPRAAYR